MGTARNATHQPFGCVVKRKTQKEVEASVSARTRKLRSGCPYVDSQLQKSSGDVWSQISSANALQKERPGLGVRRPRASVPNASFSHSGAVFERTNRESGVAVVSVMSRTQAQDVERSSSSGSAIADGGVTLAGPG